MKNKTIMQRLIRNIVLLIFLITVLILIQQKIYNDYVSESISKSYLSDLATRAETQFNNFFKPVIQNLSLFQKWGKSGLLVVHDLENINARFIPLLEELPQIHSVKIINEKQDVFALIRMKDKWWSGMIKNKQDPHNFVVEYWTFEGDYINKKRQKTTYDAFSRPWYLGAIDSDSWDSVWWTNLRPIETANTYGVTACVKWPVSNENENPTVLAFDILLKDLYESVSNIRVTENSRVLLIRSDERIFSLSTGDTLPDNIQDLEMFFIKPDQLQNAHISKAIQTWNENDKPIDDPIEISHQNTTYWFGVKSVDRERSKLWIGIIIPENDILNQLQRRQLANFSISSSILLLGIVISILMIRKYRGQFIQKQRSIIGTDDPKLRLKELINKGESDTLEFKSTMRMNLNTNQPGKEIELAWLKAVTAFMNTDGGILLLGVNDNGDFVGLEADKFENEDKCMLHFKNLINQHIGAEFTNYLNFGLLTIQDKMIGVLECEASQKPVFLKNKNDEHFYIRSGPSNTKLQTSKILEYIEDRKS